MASIRFMEDPKRDMQTMVEQCARCAVALYGPEADQGRASEEIFTTLAFGARLTGTYPAQNPDDFVEMLGQPMSDWVHGAPSIRFLAGRKPTAECVAIFKKAGP